MMLKDFLAEHGILLIAHQNKDSQDFGHVPWEVYIGDGGVAKNGKQELAIGYGETEEEAIENLAKCIAGEILVIPPDTNITVPLNIITEKSYVPEYINKTTGMLKEKVEGMVSSLKEGGETSKTVNYTLFKLNKVIKEFSLIEKRVNIPKKF